MLTTCHRAGGVTEVAEVAIGTPVGALLGLGAAPAQAVLTHGPPRYRADAAATGRARPYRRDCGRGPDQPGRRGVPGSEENDRGRGMPRASCRGREWRQLAAMSSWQRQSSRGAFPGACGGWCRRRVTWRSRLAAVLSPVGDQQSGGAVGAPAGGPGAGQPVADGRGHAGYAGSGEREQAAGAQVLCACDAVHASATG